MTDPGGAKLDKTQVDAFMADLLAITLKHGIYIWACGCCDGPSLQAIDPTDATKGLYIHSDGFRIMWCGK